MTRFVPLNGQTWLICGGRDFADQEMFDNAMSDILTLRGCPSRIVEGGARGADKMAFAWATRMAIHVTEVRADWKAHGTAADPIRNQKMLDDHKPQVVIAFPGGRGTADMIRRGHATEGVDVIEVSAPARQQIGRDDG